MGGVDVSSGRVGNIRMAAMLYVLLCIVGRVGGCVTYVLLYCCCLLMYVLRYIVERLVGGGLVGTQTLLE